jgi:hypothetical protein
VMRSILLRTLMCGISSWSIARRESKTTEMNLEASVT